MDTQGEGEFYGWVCNNYFFLESIPFLIVPLRGGIFLKVSLASLGAANVSWVLKSLNDRTQPLHSSSFAQLCVSQV